MLYLGTAEFPADERQLEQALTAGLRTVFMLPGSGRPVEAEPREAGPAEAGSPEYPQLRRLRLDLSGSELRLDEPPPVPQEISCTGQTVMAEQFEFIGRPLYHAGAMVNASVQAREAVFEYGRDARAQAWLMLSAAAEGHAVVSVSQRDLEALILIGASAAAAKQGVRVESVQLDLQARGERSLEIMARITAAKFFARAVIQITGRLEIDEELNARASDLVCRGEGMIGGIACQFLRPHLERLSNHPLPLMALSLGQVRLRDVRIDVRDGLVIEARTATAAGSPRFSGSRNDDPRP